MKQNIYDHPIFFEKYKDLRDNDRGLNELIKQPVIRKLIKNPAGANILGIGCGLGQQMAYILTKSPRSVTGVDISKKMLDELKKRLPADRVELVCSAIEDYHIIENHFDLILSSMTLHYIQDLPKLFDSIYKGLKKGGQFVFSIEHPVCTALMKEWIMTEERKVWPVADYANEGLRYQNWFLEGVVKYHRKLSTIVTDLIAIGFQIDHIEEPVPTTAVLSERTDLEQHLDRPPILIISISKKP